MLTSAKAFESFGTTLLKYKDGLIEKPPAPVVNENVPATVADKRQLK
jgi:hypothetical protein